MDGDQQKLCARIPMLRFGCLTAGNAVSFILGTPVEAHTPDCAQGLAKC